MENQATNPTEKKTWTLRPFKKEDFYGLGGAEHFEDGTAPFISTEERNTGCEIGASFMTADRNGISLFYNSDEDIFEARLDLEGWDKEMITAVANVIPKDLPLAKAQDRGFKVLL